MVTCCVPKGNDLLGLITCANPVLLLHPSHDLLQPLLHRVGHHSQQVPGKAGEPGAGSTEQVRKGQELDC